MQLQAGGWRTAVQQRSVTAAAAAGLTAAGNELLIVGPGVLGSYLGKLWLDEFGSGTVLGQTNTTNNHANLQQIGFATRTAAEAAAEAEVGAAAGAAKPAPRTFPNVAYCAPPSGSTDYAADVAAALQLWDRSGSFVFTSSAAVYTVDDGSGCDESAPTAKLGDNERTDRLLAAEQAVLAAGGNVVRLVGLYHANRGAHTFFLKQGEVQRWGGYLVNLIHYEDAASLCFAVLKGNPKGHEPFRGRVFLGCDSNPVTFQAMMDACLASPAFAGSTPVSFVGPEGASRGKRMSNDATREALGWSPRHPSFSEFVIDQGGVDWYTEVGAAPKGMAHA